MSNDRQTAPIEPPIDGAVKAPSLTPAPGEGSHAVPAQGGRSEPMPPSRVTPMTPLNPQPSPVQGPLRDVRDGAAARRRHALRIPDDEISRPQLPGTAARPAVPPAPPSEPAVQTEPAPVVKPTRIITISEPPPSSLDADLGEPGVGPAAAFSPVALQSTTQVVQSGARDALAGLEADEVEVRFDDDFPATYLPPVAPVARPALTIEPIRAPESIVAADPFRVADPVHALEPPRSFPDPPRTAVEPPRSFPDPPRTAVEPPRAPADPPRAAVEPPRAPVDPPRAAVELPRSFPDPPRAPVEPLRTSADLPRALADAPRAPPVEAARAAAEPVRAAAAEPWRTTEDPARPAFDPSRVFPESPRAAAQSSRPPAEPPRAPGGPATAEAPREVVRAAAEAPRIALEVPGEPPRAAEAPREVVRATAEAPREVARAAAEAPHRMAQAQEPPRVAEAQETLRVALAQEPPRAVAPSRPILELVEAPLEIDLPSDSDIDLPADSDRQSQSSDLPEVAAEDLVTLEPPPVRPMSAVPPIRPRAMSQPASSLHAVGPAPAAKPPRIPTPRTSLVIVPPHVGTVPSQQTDGPAVGRRKVRLWWEELFNDDYLRTTDKVGEDQLRLEVSFIEESLGVERGGTLLDLACGTGRHAIELARRGYEVVGFDLSLAMLARAGEEAQDLGAKLNFVQGDMREMTFEEQFDGVYCWSTSFGYFEEEKNAQVVGRIRRALKAGGTFLLDVANRDFLVRQSPSLAWFEGDGCVCMDEMNLDFITSRLKVKRTIMLEDGRSREIEYSMRVYSLHELGKILHDNGFTVREVSGRLASPGVFFGNESPRAIILAEKK